MPSTVAQFNEVPLLPQRNRFLRFTIFLCSLIAGIFFYCFGPYGIFSEGNRTEDIVIIIKPGTSSLDIAKQLSQKRILESPWPFFSAQYLHYPRRKLKAGEYLVEKSASPWEIIDQMASGRTVIRHFTVPEGLTVAQIVTVLKSTDSLSGQITAIPTEGALLPETYSYSYGDDRQQLLDRMYKAMNAVINELWPLRRSNDSIIDSPETALILASIVEKETGVPRERKRIAGVFLNRLKVGMRLQADPTVIYAITKGTTTLNRGLTRKDLQVISPFNTYAVTGLPPHPIACPGRSAIEAVLVPEHTEDLYFVADGTGGHAFSKTLNDHNNHVKTWRQINRRK
jgi:UPF0755 protein